MERMVLFGHTKTQILHSISRPNRRNGSIFPSDTPCCLVVSPWWYDENSILGRSVVGIIGLMAWDWDYCTIAISISIYGAHFVAMFGCCMISLQSCRIALLEVVVGGNLKGILVVLSKRIMILLMTMPFMLQALRPFCLNGLRPASKRLQQWPFWKCWWPLW